VSGWDWSVWWPLAELAWEVCCEIQQIPLESDLARLQRLVVRLHFCKIVSAGDRLYEQCSDRTWESGSYLTALFNTVMRVIVAHLV
jgi:hypothetical protein